MTWQNAPIDPRDGDAGRLGRRPGEGPADAPPRKSPGRRVVRLAQVIGFGALPIALGLAFLASLGVLRAQDLSVIEDGAQFGAIGAGVAAAVLPFLMFDDKDPIDSGFPRQGSWPLALAGALMSAVLAAIVLAVVPLFDDVHDDPMSIGERVWEEPAGLVVLAAAAAGLALWAYATGAPIFAQVRPIGVLLAFVGGWLAIILGGMVWFVGLYDGRLDLARMLTAGAVLGAGALAALGTSRLLARLPRATDEIAAAYARRAARY